MSIVSIYEHSKSLKQLILTKLWYGFQLPEEDALSPALEESDGLIRGLRHTARNQVRKPSVNWDLASAIL